MDEKLAVVTLNVGDSMKEIARLTYSFMRRYAAKIGATFIVMNQRLITAENELPLHFEKYQLRYILELYDRVLFIDTDAFPAPDCPSLFDLVPEGKLGVYVVTPYTQLHDDSMKMFLAKAPHLQWDGHYFNSGVMVLSKPHRELFNLEFGSGIAFGEQTQLNINRLWTGIKLHDIGFRYNHTTVPANVSKDKSYILHYPGTDKKKTLKSIRQELERRGLK